MSSPQLPSKTAARSTFAITPHTSDQAGFDLLTAQTSEIKSEQKTIRTHIIRSTVSMLIIAMSLARCHKLLRPHGGAVWQAFLDSVAISKSHGYQLIRVADKFSDLPQKVTENFSITSLTILANANCDAAIEDAIEQSEQGCRISVSAAKELVKKHRGDATANPSQAVKVTVGDMATLVIHAKRNSDITRLRQVIEMAVQQFVNRESKNNG